MTPGALDVVAVLTWAIAPTTALLVAQSRLRAAGSRAITMTAVGAGAVGFAVIGVALAPGVDAWAGSRFAHHMGQHLAVGLIGPLLVVTGRVTELLPWVLPARYRPRARRTMGRLLRPPRSVVVPAVALVATWYGWHLPAAYGAAADHTLAHMLEHVTLVGTGLWYWAAVAPHRHGRGAEVLASFTVSVSLGLLAAILSLSPVAFYADHVVVAGSGAQLDDQHLGGLVMWTPGGLLFLLAALVQLVRWLDLPDAERARLEPGGRL